LLNHTLTIEKISLKCYNYSAAAMLRYFCFHMAKSKRYGIKFPFNVLSPEKTMVDLNTNKSDSVRSQIMHLIFTPVGQRLRKPTFGSKLIQYIFEPNDDSTWSDVVSEIKSMISSNIPNCTLNDINVYEADEGRSLVASIDYTVTENGVATTSKIMTNL